jgi:mannose-1-phosphate guanylyltransferase
MDRPPIIPVILSGGTGVRLWPLSRLGRPKQLVALVPGPTLLQQTAARIADRDRFAPPLVVAGVENAEAIADQLGADMRLILEPAPRNTAPAVALAALEAGADDLLLVLPSDHAIADEAAFSAAVAAAAPFAQEGWLVTFGVRPDRPETGYGWLRRGAPLAPNLFEAATFVEKPPLDRAEAFLAEGGYDWNAGMFLFRAGVLVAALEAHAPDVLAAARAALSGARREAGRVYPATDAFAAAPAISLDKAVMEKAERVAVAAVEMGWSDVGSWDAVHALGPRDADGNLLAGDVVAPGSRNCLIRSDGPAVVALGVEDLIVVATERAVLVARRGESQRIGEAIDALEARRHKPRD